MITLNRVYSVLMRGDVSAVRWYGRAATPVYRPSGRRYAEAEAIRQGSRDPSYWSFAADAIVQAALASSMRNDIFEYDQLNTYLLGLELASPGRVTVTVGLPASSSVQYGEVSADENWVELFATLQLNADVGQVTLNGATQAYTVSGGLSSPVELGPGVNMRLRGITSGTHQIGVRLTRPPLVDLVRMRRDILAAGSPWTAKYAPLYNSGDIGEWFGGFLLDYCASEGI